MQPTGGCYRWLILKVFLCLPAYRSFFRFVSQPTVFITVYYAWLYSICCNYNSYGLFIIYCIINMLVVCINVFTCLFYLCEHVTDLFENKTQAYLDCVILTGRCTLKYCPLYIQ